MSLIASGIEVQKQPISYTPKSGVGKLGLAALCCTVIGAVGYAFFCLTAFLYNRSLKNKVTTQVPEHASRVEAASARVFPFEGNPQVPAALGEPVSPAATEPAPLAKTELRALERAEAVVLPDSPVVDHAPQFPALPQSPVVADALQFSVIPPVALPEQDHVPEPAALEEQDEWASLRELMGQADQLVREFDASSEPGEKKLIGDRMEKLLEQIERDEKRLKDKKDLEALSESTEIEGQDDETSSVSTEALFGELEKLEGQDEGKASEATDWEGLEDELLALEDEIIQIIAEQKKAAELEREKIAGMPLPPSPAEEEAPKFPGPEEVSPAVSDAPSTVPLADPSSDDDSKAEGAPATPASSGEAEQPQVAVAAAEPADAPATPAVREDPEMIRMRRFGAMMSSPSSPGSVPLFDALRGVWTDMNLVMSFFADLLPEGTTIIQEGTQFVVRCPQARSFVEGFEGMGELIAPREMRIEIRKGKVEFKGNQLKYVFREELPAEDVEELPVNPKGMTVSLTSLGPVQDGKVTIDVTHSGGSWKASLAAASALTGAKAIGKNKVPSTFVIENWKKLQWQS